MKKVWMVITMGCFKSAGLAMIIMKMAENLLLWFRTVILNFYDNGFGGEEFLRIIDWMPYIIGLDFEDNKLVGKYEHCYVEKEFKGDQCADKK